MIKFVRSDFRVSNIVNRQSSIVNYLRPVQTDFLIIGQGLAGTALSMNLIDAGASIHIIDNKRKSNSSRIAAGLFNPLVFRRITFGWRGMELLNAAQDFYTSAEEKLEERFFQSEYLYRVHGTEDERDNWLRLLNEPDFNQLLGLPEEPSERPWLHQPFGGAKVKGAGYLDTEIFLDGMRSRFKNNGQLSEIDFNSEKLELKVDSVSYEGIKAKTIIFCEGYLGNDNPWFGNLPFNPAKGELLVIKAPELPDEIFNGGVYGVPLGNGFFKVGSTYSWEFEDASPTVEGRAELKQRLEEVLAAPYEIVSHEAGIRPTVRDRRPLVGFHPLYPRLAIFNGLGTKGVLLAPLISKEFAESLVSGSDFNADYSIERFRKHLISTPYLR